jgi:proteasome assembly chaperone (PAC2) family protein
MTFSTENILLKIITSICLFGICQGYILDEQMSIFIVMRMVECTEHIDHRLHLVIA